jgi:hypothetical protein
MQRQRSIRLFASILLLALVCPFGLAQNAARSEQWVATWGAAMHQPAATAGYTNQTFRMFVRTSIAGSRVRLQLSNTFGAAPLLLGPVHLALHSQGSAIVPGTDHALQFGGKPSRRPEEKPT